MKNIVRNLKNKMEKETPKLKKKAGVEKLVITLVLVAVGVGLCVIFRNQLYILMTEAFTSLGTQIKSLLSGTVSNG